MEDRSRLPLEGPDLRAAASLPRPGTGTVDPAGHWMVRYTIGFKIFAIAAGLLVIMAGATLSMVRMSRDLGNELAFFADTYLPSYAAIARANVRSVERALALRRLVIASTDTAAAPERRQALREQFAELGRQGEEGIALARTKLAKRLERPGGYDDVVAVARLDTRLGELSTAADMRYWPRSSSKLSSDATTPRFARYWPRSTSCATTSIGLSMAPAATCSRSSPKPRRRLTDGSNGWFGSAYWSRPSPACDGLDVLGLGDDAFQHGDLLRADVTVRSAAGDSLDTAQVDHGADG